MPQSNEHNPTSGQLAEISAKLRYDKANRHISIIGPTSSIATRLTGWLRNAGYQIQHVPTAGEMLETTGLSEIILAIFCDGQWLLRNPSLITRITERQPGVPTIAIAADERDRLAIIRAGLNGCLLQKDSEPLVIRAIEEILVKYKLLLDSQSGAGQNALIITRNNTAKRAITTASAERAINWHSIANVKNIRKFLDKHLSLAIVETSPRKAKILRSLCRNLPQLPIVAMCSDLVDGQFALANGAWDFITMPPEQRDILATLDKIRSQANVVKEKKRPLVLS